MITVNEKTWRKYVLTFVYNKSMTLWEVIAEIIWEMALAQAHNTEDSHTDTQEGKDVSVEQ